MSLNKKQIDLLRNSIEKHSFDNAYNEGIFIALIFLLALFLFNV